MNDTHLGPETEAAISDLVGKGLFASRIAVLREGVRLVHQRETRFAALAAAVAGEPTPGEDAVVRLDVRRRPIGRDET